jgi:hypothetical protein
MTTAKVTFHRMLQDTQNYHSFNKNDDHLVSILYFTLEIGGRVYPNMSVEVRQPYGTEYDNEPLEVAQPTGPYKRPWDHKKFAEMCEEYHRDCIGSGGTLSIGNAELIRMRENLVSRECSCQFEIPDGGSTAW